VGRSRRLGGVAGLRAAERAARGLVLIDPPYEQKDEFRSGSRTGFAEAIAKWPTGSYLLWYPVKSRRATDNLARHVAEVAGTVTPAGKMPASGIQRRARRQPMPG